VNNITAPQLAQWIADPSRPAPLLLDVREPWEFETCHIQGALLVPLNSITVRHEALDKSRSIVCICHHGGRSAGAVAFLENQGFSQVFNLTGGMHAWALQVDTTMPTY